MTQTIAHTRFDFPSLSLYRRGKVRDVFDFGDNLLIVSSDRVSAFDEIIDSGIPNKGHLLTKMSAFWFGWLPYAHHLISTDVADFPKETRPYHAIMAGRSMLVKKTKLIPIECVVRGYLSGSGWQDYQRTGHVCGHTLPKGLSLAQQLETPLFTPASKSFDGHDENITIANMADRIGKERTQQLEAISLAIYNQAAAYALDRGIIIADTKFEFGLLDDAIIVIDEVLTPDSSRFWPKDQVQLGQSPPSFDKQIIRDYISSTHWDHQSPIPSLPDSIIAKTAAQYEAIYQRLAGPSHGA
jgi:phosphoribosylaminoimidazole-succinocarboxamide synthase